MSHLSIDSLQREAEARAKHLREVYSIEASTKDLFLYADALGSLSRQPFRSHDANDVLLGRLSLGSHHERR